MAHVCNHPCCFNRSKVATVLKGKCSGMDLGSLFFLASLLLPEHWGEIDVAVGDFGVIAL